MANEVNNTLVTRGPNPLITQLKISAQYDPSNTEWVQSMGCKHANNSLFSFACLYPVPEPLLEEERKSFKSTTVFSDQIADSEESGVISHISNAETWKFEHWGTDRDVFDVAEKLNEPDQWVIRFTSRWYSPLEAIQKISGDHPGLTFELGYWSCDSDFQGDAVFKDGVCILDERAVWVPEQYVEQAKSLSDSEKHPFILGSLLKQHSTN
jgi:hypothetical protein